jgi:hypothetical protein
MLPIREQLTDVEVELKLCPSLAEALGEVSKYGKSMFVAGFELFALLLMIIEFDLIAYQLCHDDRTEW